MDINKLIRDADEAIKVGRLKTAWKLLKPYADNTDVRRRLRWIRKNVQEAVTNNGQDAKQNDEIGSYTTTDHISKIESVEVTRTEHKNHITYDSNSAGTSPALFDVRTRGGDIKICLNMRHPLYPLLHSAMSSQESRDIETLSARLSNAQTVIDMLLCGWSTFENDEPIGPRLNRVQLAREDWGRTIRNLMQNSEEDD